MDEQGLVTVTGPSHGGVQSLAAAHRTLVAEAQRPRMRTAAKQKVGKPKRGVCRAKMGGEVPRCLRLESAVSDSGVF